MKKGFTLVELLAVLIIIGILLTISAIAVIPIKEQSANSLYNEQVKRIEGAAKLWAMDNSGLLYGKESYALTLDSLIESDFLKEDQIIDPRSNELMSGCVIITYGNQNYSYNYNEDCDWNEPILIKNNWLITNLNSESYKFISRKVCEYK